LKPGDLVRVRNLAPVAAVHHGKIGVVISAAPGVASGAAYDVLLDGGIAHFYGVYLELLEPVNETR
jgi:hypothetical protein